MFRQDTAAVRLDLRLPDDMHPGTFEAEVDAAYAAEE
jgi:hypothetical protein